MEMEKATVWKAGSYWDTKREYDHTVVVTETYEILVGNRVVSTTQEKMVKPGETYVVGSSGNYSVRPQKPNA